MPKFSIKSLMTCTVLIAIGLSIFSVCHNIPKVWVDQMEEFALPAIILMWLTASALVAGPIGYLIRWPKTFIFLGTPIVFVVALFI